MLIRGGSWSYGETLIRPPANINVALVGDSITALPGESSFYWINALTGGALRIVKNAGVGSERVTGTIARIDNSYTSSPPGLTGLDLGWVFLRIGTNDVAVDYPLASIDSEYDALIDAIMAHCGRLVIMAVPPIGTNSTLPREYNEYLAAKCAGSERMNFVDDCADLRSDPDTQIGSFFIDGVHPNEKGVYTMGVAGAADAGLAALLEQYTDSPLISDPDDVYPDSPLQWVTNPFVTGTGGSLGSGFSGQLADSWSISRTGSPLAATCSKVAADVDDPNQNGWQRVAMTTGGASNGFAVETSLAGGGGPDDPPVEVAIEIRLNAANTTALCDISTEVRHTDEPSDYLSPPSSLLCYNAGTVSKRAVIRTAIPRNNSGGHDDAIFALRVRSTANPASPGSFDFRCASVRGQA